MSSRKSQSNKIDMRKDTYSAEDSDLKSMTIAVIFSGKRRV